MSRRNHRQHRPQANREVRGMKTIKASRMVSPEESLGIAGVVRDTFRDNEDWPAPSSIPKRHRVFLLDPRIVRRELRAGFAMGFSVAHVTSQIKAGVAPEHVQPFNPDDVIEDARLGTLVMLNHRILASYIESKQAVDERRAIYAILGANGIRGFNKKEHRTPPQPLAVLAHLPVVHDKVLRKEITDGVTDALSIHQTREITLGPMTVLED